MGAAHPAHGAPGIEMGGEPVERRARIRRQARRIRGRKNTGIAFGEGLRVALHHVGEALAAPILGAAGRQGVKGRDLVGQLGHQRGRELAAHGHVVEEGVLVEAGHDQEPIHRLAIAIEREGAVRVARDRDYTEVEVGGGAAIDAQLRLADPAPQLDRAEIEVGKAHRALELVCAIAGQEENRAVGIDTLDRLDARPIRPRAGKEGDKRALILDDHDVPQRSMGGA